MSILNSPILRYSASPPLFSLFYQEREIVTKKIALITGVTGQDGSYLAEFLLEKNYGTQLDLVDLAFSVDPITGETGLRLIQQDLGQKNIPVSSGDGFPLSAQHKDISPKRSDATSLTFGTLLPSGELEPARTFQPFWSN
jgi:hypothetical protein